MTRNGSAFFFANYLQPFLDLPNFFGLAFFTLSYAAGITPVVCI